MTRSLIPPRTIPRTGDDRPARSLYRYVWRMSGLHQLCICLLAIAVASLSVVPLELERRIINDALDQESLNHLVQLAGWFAGVLLAQGVLKFGLRVYQGWLSESAIRYNRHHLSSLLEHPGENEGGNEGEADGENDGVAADGRAVSVIGPEIDRLGGFVGEGLSQPLVNLGMLLSIGTYMIVVEPKVGLFSLMLLVPQVIVAPLIQRRINRLVERRIGLMRRLSDAIATQANGGEADGTSDLGRDIDRVYGNRIEYYLVKFAMKGLINLLNGLAPLSALAVGGYFVIQGETTIGVVVAFMSGLQRLSNPFRELIAYYRIAAQARVQHEMIARWM